MLIARIRSLLPLSNDAAAILDAMPLQMSSVRKGEHVVHQGDHSSRACLLLDGVLAFSKTGPEGERQITALHIKGDIPDLHSLHLKILDSGLQALTPCKLAFIQHDTVLDVCRRSPEIATAFWKMTLVDASIYREWIVALGRLDALARLSHLFCEFLVRMRAVGESDGNSCAFGLSQTDLADAMGSTPVHVNRTLQDLRGKRLIELDRRTLRILDWNGLSALANFDPAYLHLEGEAAVRADRKKPALV